MGGGGKSRTQKVEQETKLDPDIKKAAMMQFALAQGAASLPFAEQKAGTIAAMTPMQKAAMRNMNAGMERFGFDTPSVDAGLPETVDTGGISSYSISPAYEEMKKGLPKEYLEGIEKIRNAYSSMSKDGAEGKNDTASGKNSPKKTSTEKEHPLKAIFSLGNDDNKSGNSTRGTK